MEHVGDNPMHLSVIAEMEAYVDQGAGHTVILEPIVREIRGEELNKTHVELLKSRFTHYTGLYHHTLNTCNPRGMMID